jgi:hypothetical protein
LRRHHRLRCWSLRRLWRLLLGCAFNSSPVTHQTAEFLMRCRTLGRLGRDRQNVPQKLLSQRQLAVLNGPSCAFKQLCRRYVLRGLHLPLQGGLGETYSAIERHPHTPHL